MGVLRDDFYRVLRRTGERQRTQETEEPPVIVETSTIDVSNPPTSAQLTTAFGTVEGKAVAIDDNGVGANYSFSIVINGAWVNFIGTAAP